MNLSMRMICLQRSIWNTGRLQCVTEEEIEQNGAMKVDIIS